MSTRFSPSLLSRLDVGGNTADLRIADDRRDLVDVSDVAEAA
ncbi:hypothetical protein [Kibdelosporangium aridum]